MPDYRQAELAGWAIGDKLAEATSSSRRAAATSSRRSTIWADWGQFYAAPCHERIASVTADQRHVIDPSCSVCKLTEIKFAQALAVVSDAFLCLVVIDDYGRSDM